jgi:hypothetical protein
MRFNRVLLWLALQPGWREMVSLVPRLWSGEGSHGQELEVARYRESELIWDVIAGETQISLQVGDNRLFAGCWNYATICYWGVGENGSAVDLII